MDTTEDVGSGESVYLDQPGTYHCVITSIMEGQGPKGGSIDGFTVGLAVLAGTTEGQKDKNTNLCLFAPDASKGEKSQEWARKKQTAFAIAAGLIDLAKLGGKVNIELQDAVGRQIIVGLEHDEAGKYLQLAWANIYHIDDPRAAEFPKDAEAIAMATMEMQRKPSDYFTPLMKKAAPAKAGQSRLSNDELADL